MAIGATFCQWDYAPNIAARISALAIDRVHGSTNELHWTNLKGHTVDMYRDVVSEFMQMRVERLVRYRCLTIEKSKLDHRKFSDGDRDLTLTKFIFTHVYEFARQFAPSSRFCVFIDERETKHTADRMLHTLNNKWKSEFEAEEVPFKTVKFVSSQASRLIQITDVITGAIAYQTNGWHEKQSPAKHKVALMRHVSDSAGLATLARPTNKWPFNFVIRPFRFTEKGSSR